MPSKSFLKLSAKRFPLSKKIKGFEKEKEGQKRCLICYQIRLEKMVQYLDDYDCFATTLTISPYKNKKKIDQIGKNINTNYLIINLPNNAYQEGISLSKKHQLYRQNYCGCLLT